MEEMIYQIFCIVPIVSILIAISLIWASIGLVKESSSILMQFTPKEIELSDVIKTVIALPKIDNMHHIHLWKLDDHRIHLEAHLEFNENITIQESNNTIDTLGIQLEELFGISHITFQCEYKRCDDKEIINN